MRKRRQSSVRGLVTPLAVLILSAGLHGAGAAPDALERDLKVTLDGHEKQVSLKEAMVLLKVPSVSFALIHEGRLENARAYGEGATPATLYQAASLSKLVAAAGAMRLVEQGRLSLDGDVNATLKSWQVPPSPLAKERKVTLRGLLSMTGGIGVPGFLGYGVGTPLPSLTQILDGAAPANSPPVTIVAVPGASYFYSGGGYEIAEALMSEAAGTSFPEAMDALVLKPAGMSDSSFAQTLPKEKEARAVAGHSADGKPLPGRWHVFPEHAAAGLWATPTDLARLLLLIGEAWRGESRIFLSPGTAREMLTPHNGGPYGLGGAVGAADGEPLLMKRGQNVGYQGYLILFPGSGQGIVVLTNSDNCSVLAEALIRRAAALYAWPPFGALAD